MANTPNEAGGAPLANKALMMEAARLLHPGRVVELRVLNVDGRGWTASGYFDQPLKLAEAALRYNGRAEGVYLTLNPVAASLLARSNNALRERAKTTTSDAEVLRRAWLPIDLDPTRPSGISSSEAEHRAALEQARRIWAWLRDELRWPAPLFADSGNGAHLLYVIDLPNDAESAALVKRCLAALASRFDTPEVTLDQSVYNAARIWKLYGSVARKGEHLPERPHRLARLLETPDPLTLVRREQLLALAALAPGGGGGSSGGAPAGVEGVPEEGQAGAARSGDFNRRAVTEADVLAWLAEHGAAVRQTKREGTRALYLLERCPFNPDHHEPGKACLSLGDDGALGFHCFAASCANYHWQDLKALWQGGPRRLAAPPDEPAQRARRADSGKLNLSPEEARAHLAALVPGLQRLDALMAQEFTETRWVVPGLLPEGLTLLAAKPKLGKSWLALGLALAVAAGGVALGQLQVEQGAVLYLALEDSPKRLHSRTRQLLADQAVPEALEIATEWPRLDAGGLGLLDVWLQAHKDARLMILDTLAKIRGQARSATLYGDDYASLEGAQRLAHTYGVALLVIHHTGKESRDDPLDEVNATQGLNGVADNVLVLRRERGKPQATLFGDGRELNGIEQTLAFDGTTGAWTLTEPEPEQPKTPERAEILDVLRASAEPMSPKQIAEALEKNINTASTLLRRMVRDGDITLAGHGKYIPVTDVTNVTDEESLHIKNDEKKKHHTLFDKQEDSPEPTSVTFVTSVTGDREPEAETAEDAIQAPSSADPLVAPPSRRQGRGDGAAPAAPSSRPLDPARLSDGGTDLSDEEYAAIATPDQFQPGVDLAGQPWPPTGRVTHLRPPSLANAPTGSLWPIYGECTGVFCEGACVCGEHLCERCGCEAGALVDNHPWYYDRRKPRPGTICAYCFAPATVASRWQTPLCERCWQIASRGLGIDPRSYQPRPFGPIAGDDELN